MTNQLFLNKLVRGDAVANSIQPNEKADKRFFKSGRSNI